jgi:hypothetical protein
MKITNYTLLRAISKCTQDKYILDRSALAGIYFEPALGLATATDGHRLMTGLVSLPEEGADPFLWVPASSLPFWKGEVTLDGPVLKAGPKLVGGKLSPERYPDYRKVLPADTEGQSISFDPLLLADVQKALGAKGVRMQWKDGAILVSFRGVDMGPECSFYLMPMGD